LAPPPASTARIAIGAARGDAHEVGDQLGRRAGTPAARTTVFSKDLNEFGKMNEVYATYFKVAPPARATVEAARLPRDVKVEISAIAVHP
jgi:enamine deaminase RidA (YjgF/YER057c/UK114 family)